MSMKKSEALARRGGWPSRTQTPWPGLGFGCSTQVPPAAMPVKLRIQTRETRDTLPRQA